ncbi:hypothetical protein F0562_010988 [Nyssa sinensis]|uniref:Retrotransposon Copia-like N-terminal domain-containing protein n=1 Tax=Nyssa sinensis TaxID=561372 RepID=A0A5J5A0F4_9ASTE|nr:hypothetical protein F0562_010988 [Nyssa sinensis]
MDDQADSSSDSSPTHSVSSSIHSHHPPNPPHPKQYLNLIDPNNPFRLDHGNNPAVILVTDLFTTYNYPTWSRAMHLALRAKNKLGFITNDIPRPKNPNDPLLDLWDRCNDMVLKKSLAGILQDNDSVGVYYRKLKTLWDELSIYDPIPVCNCDTMKTLVDWYQRDCVFQFLMGLHDIYSNVRDQIMLLDPLPSVTRVFSLIQQQECQHSLIQHSPFLDTMALAINRPFLTSKMSNSFKPNPKKDRPYCTHCKITDYTLESCFKIGNAEAPVCRHCHMTGHTVEKCYKLHGYPPGHKFFNKPQPSVVLATQSTIFPFTNLEAHSDDKVDLTKARYQQLMALFQPRGASIAAQHSANQIQSNFTISSTSNFSGPCLLDNDWEG